MRESDVVSRRRLPPRRTIVLVFALLLGLWFVLQHPPEERSNAVDATADMTPAPSSFPENSSDGEAATYESAPKRKAPAGSLATTALPRINERHIFDGEINRRGRPVGFHSRPGGRDPPGARVVRISSRPNGQGVYDAQIEIQDGASGTWLGKRSTFYPDDLSRDEVLAAIRHAYEHRTLEDDNRWRGPSGHGFTIEGYLLRDGTINTAYPLYRP